jgi:hypothetical protein
MLVYTCLSTFYKVAGWSLVKSVLISDYLRIGLGYLVTVLWGEI